MSKLYTEREAVQRERDAFMNGARFQYEHWNEFRKQTTAVNHFSFSAASEEASRRYKAKVTRPRVVRVGELEYRISEGVIEFRKPCDKPWCDHAEWRDCMKWLPSSRTQDEVKALTDLLARPTEEVEE